MPVGARVSRFSDALQEPAGIALGPDGAVYATTQPAAGAGQVVRLVDADDDGQAERVEPVAGGLAWPRGLAWLTPAGQEPVLLVAVREGLVVVEAGQPRLAGRLGSGAGRANDVVVGTDGRVYVTEGAAADGEPQPGAVWRFDPAELLTAGRPVQGELFVSGLRSAGGIAFSPSGAIYVADSGQGWPFRADVPDELNVLLGGGDYGWPQVWGQPPPDSGSIGPMALFPAGSEAAGLVFTSGRMFDEAAADLLVALPGQGQVVRVEIISDAAGYHSVVHDFIGGLQRPAALAEGLQGELYIADAAAGALYRLWR
jgi:glucose/arabinose dehydrogenase